MSDKKGSCGCGALQYRVEGEPINTVFCYCQACQAQTSSDKWFGAWFAKDKFNITAGTPSTYKRKGASGSDVNCLFCQHCGTTVAAEVTIGSFYSVGVATLENSQNLRPNMAIYTASASAWAVFPEDVPKFDILPPNMGA